jgi:cytochrome c oxidase subunit 3
MENTQKVRTKTMLVYVAILSIVMLFAAFTSAYVVSMGNGFWVDIKMPKAFYLSTIAIITSSFTMWWAIKSIKNNNQKGLKAGLTITLILGLVFAWFQFQGWGELVFTGNYVSGDIGNLHGVYGEDYTFSYQGVELVKEDGNFYFPNDSMKEQPLNADINKEFNAASGYFYVLTFLHLLHLAGGLIYLIYVLVLSYKGRFSSENYLKPKLVSIYWNFLDILWVYLFFFLLFIH